MSNEYRELVNRLTKARNFKCGAYILATSESDGANVKVATKGSQRNIAAAAVRLIEEILSTVDFDTQKYMCDKLTHIISESNSHRFQALGGGA